MALTKFNSPAINATGGGVVPGFRTSVARQPGSDGDEYRADTEEAGKSITAKSGTKDLGDLYQASVDMASSQLAGLENTDERQYAELIDKNFEDLQGKAGFEDMTSGHDFRGENIFTDAVKGLNTGIDAVNSGIGSALDGIWDNTVGSLAYNLGWGDAAKDWFDAEDAAMVGDVLTTLGLSAIPGVGIPLAVGKNLVQQSDNIYEGLTGRDDLTGRALSDEERGYKGQAALLSTALSAVPGAGRAASKVAAGIPSKGMEKLAGSAVKGVGDTAKKAGKGLYDASILPEAGALAKNVGSKVPEAIKTAAGKPGSAIGKVDDLVNRLPWGVPRLVHAGGLNTLTYPAKMFGGMYSGGVGMSAENGLDPMENMTNLMYSPEGMSMALMSALPGAGTATRRLVNPKAKASSAGSAKATDTADKSLKERIKPKLKPEPVDPKKVAPPIQLTSWYDAAINNRTDDEEAANQPYRSLNRILEDIGG